YSGRPGGQINLLLAEAHNNREEKEPAHKNCGLRARLEFEIVDPNHGHASQSVRHGQKNLTYPSRKNLVLFFGGGKYLQCSHQLLTSPRRSRILVNPPAASSACRRGTRCWS